MEFLEDALKFRGRNPDAVVPDLDNEPARGCFVRTDRDCDFGRTVAVAHGVGEEIYEGLAQPPAVGIDEGTPSNALKCIRAGNDGAFG